jgi:hypothetical protein
LIRIRIQHFRQNTDPDPRFDDQKLKKKKYSKFGQKQFTHPQASMRTSKLKKKPSALKRENPALQNMKFLYFFLLLWVIFALLDLDPDSESGSTDPIESGSATLG